MPCGIGDCVVLGVQCGLWGWFNGEGMTMKTRELTADEVQFSVECCEEYQPIEGNCSAIDEETDRETEEWIRRQLDKGNQWAWCCVKVEAYWCGFRGVTYLGCCSYLSEKSFKEPGGYYDDMKAEALADLNYEVQKTAKSLAVISSI
jgi:hypothetical protein